MKKLYYIVIFIILLIAFLFPKPCDRVNPSTTTYCNCFGLKMPPGSYAPSFCSGIPFNCHDVPASGI